MQHIRTYFQTAPDATNGVILLLQVPRTNDKKELAAEQMFACLHGLLTLPSTSPLTRTQRERISFEIAVQKKRIGFYVWVPDYLKNFVEEQIYAQYPNVQISEVQDYASASDDYTTTLVSELQLTSNNALPIKTFQSFEVDPLAAITATLARFEENEEAWIQMITRPAGSQWHKRSESYVASLRGGGGSGMNPATLLRAFWGSAEEGKSSSPSLTEYEQSRARAAEEKSHKLAFETVIRVVYRGNLAPAAAKLRLQSIVASYKQFNTTYLNGFKAKSARTPQTALQAYRARQAHGGGPILNIEEIATLYHLPHTTVETPYILWAASQTAEPPATLPVVTNEYREDLSPVGVANFRGHNTAFGLLRTDRGRHLYIIGQTGVGKSGMLELLTISDIYNRSGFAVIDPHGDYALSILKRIPADRAQDVIYFNPADTDFPIAFNPMEVNDPKLKTHTVSELIGVLKRMFDSWGPRLEYILRYTLLALLDYPNATMLDITRLLTNKQFRKEVLAYCQDPVVRNFWEVEFASWNDKFATEAVAPVLNKVGAFTANPLVRNIIGQPKSSFNIRKIMDEKKILIVNLSRGLVGEDNAALLGALLVTKIQLAAMSRADIPVTEREPFYLYVDEFQNFAADSFATILSEARKYGLNLTVANQYIAQMSMEVRDAVFGNVGSIIAFRMGADDARSMTRYFEPKFEEHDLVHMHNRHFVISMTINGEKTQAFSGISLSLPAYGADNTAAIVEHSRNHYAVSLAAVSQYVHERYIDEPQAAPQKQPAAKPVQSPQKSAPVQHITQPVNSTPDQPAAASSAPTATQQKPEPASQTPDNNQNSETAPVEKPKRKRLRRRKNKQAAASQPGRDDLTDDTTIHLH